MADRSNTWPEEIKSGDMFLDLEVGCALVYIDHGNIWNFLFVPDSGGGHFGLNCPENYYLNAKPVKHNISTECVYVGNISERLQELVSTLIKEHTGHGGYK